MTDTPEKIWAFPTHVKETHGYFSPSQTNKVEVGHIGADLVKKARNEALKEAAAIAEEITNEPYIAAAILELLKLEKNDE